MNLNIRKSVQKQTKNGNTRKISNFRTLNSSSGNQNCENPAGIMPKREA